MSSFTFTAKRNFVKTALNISASDISILASDDSFNSATTDLSGLVSGDWVLVSGTAVDDGWHQLSAGSTANKSTTLSTLTDETAGSSISIIGYKHGLDVSYDLETPSQILNQSHKAKTKKAESLSSVVETLFFNEIEYWDVKTGIITESELPYWLEFFSSLGAGESFSFDPYGTIASPDNVLSCMLEGNPKHIRISSIKKYTFSFKVRVI